MGVASAVGPASVGRGRAGGGLRRWAAALQAHARAVTDAARPAALGRPPGRPLPCAVLFRSAAPHVAASQPPPSRSALHPDLRLALAAAAAVPGPDRGSVRLRVPVRQCTVALDP